jgi:hypothetical protein
MRAFCNPGCRTAVGGVVFALMVLASPQVFAQGAPPAQGVPVQPAAGDASKSPKHAPTAESLEKARAHYERGLQLFNEENYDIALFEFARAYEYAPSYKILYNMARIHRQQNRYAEALNNYKAYLREGAAEIAGERKVEVEKEIALLQSRVASLKVTTKIEGADVYIDDGPICTGATSSCVGKTPLVEAIVVNPGRRKITISKSGFVPATRMITVVGGDTATVDVDLTSLDRPDRPVDPAPRNRAIVSWSVTGAFAITAAVTAIIANGAASDLKADREKPLIDRKTLDDDSSKTKTFALVSDIFTVGAAVGGIVSTYLTIKAFQAGRVQEATPPPATGAKAQPPKASKLKLDVAFGPASALIVGKF